MVEVRILGDLEVRVDGAPVALPADARARELLAWLAAHPGLHPRSTLAGRLRPDVPEESARKSLRHAVYELRRALPAAAQDGLAATREHVGLLAGSVSVDRGEFRRLVAADELERAVDLSVGDLLAGIDPDWALAAREEHATELAACLAELARRAEAEGDLPRAVVWTRRRLEVEPLAESAHRDLVRLLALGGDRPAALAAYEALAARLRRELCLPPSAETRALVEGIRGGRLARAPAAPASQAALPPPLARTARPVGRAAALERLESAWTEAAAGGLRLACVAGEPGIGKTTLVGELARRLHAGGVTVLYGRSDEDALLPYQPWVEALEGHLGALGADEREGWRTSRGGALTCLLPGLDGPHERDADPETERYLAFETARELLEQAGAPAGLLLVLDDLHWADAGSLRLLRHVARTTARARVLVAVCVREAELSPDAAATLADLRREGPLLSVVLDGLEAEDVEALLARRGDGADAGLARRLRARTGGNPFFLGELLSDGVDPEGAGPPQGVREVLGRRLGRLVEAAGEALSVGAVIGLEWDVATVARALEREPADVLEALDGPRAAGLAAEAGPVGRYAFAHALVAEALLAGMPPSRRARLHLRVADALEEGGAEGGAAGEIARHLRAAGPLVSSERSAAAELAAARQATAALAHEEAAGHYEAALGVLPPDREGGFDRAEALLGLGDARERMGCREAARNAFSEAAALALERGDGRLLARAALGYGGLGVVIAAPDPTAVSLLERALAGLPASERGTRARTRARLAVELYYGDRDRAEELSAEAVVDARATDDPATLAAALNARRVVIWSPAYAEERLRVATEMAALAGAGGDREAALQGHNWRVVDLLELGRTGEAAAAVELYERLAGELGLPHYRWYVPLWRAGLALGRGRWEEARALGDEALAIGEDAEDPNAALLVRIQRECALEAQHRHAEMDRAWVEGAMASSPVPGAWASWLAQMDVRARNLDSARRLVAELARDGCAAMPTDANWHALCDLAEAAIEVGDREAAAAVHDRLAPHARLFPIVARGVCSYGSAEYYVGRLACALGRLDEAEARLGRAVEENRRIGAGPRAALALLRLGGVLAARGERARARGALAEAEARARQLAMPALAAEAGEALRRLGGR